MQPWLNDPISINGKLTSNILYKRKEFNRDNSSLGNNISFSSYILLLGNFFKHLNFSTLWLTAKYRVVNTSFEPYNDYNIWTKFTFFLAKLTIKSILISQRHFYIYTTQQKPLPNKDIKLLLHNKCQKKHSRGKMRYETKLYNFSWLSLKFSH